MSSLFADYMRVGRWGTPDSTLPKKIEEAYDRLVNAGQGNPTMPEVLALSLSVTAANARFLYEKSHDDIELIYGALALFDLGNNVLDDWIDSGGDMWLRPVHPDDGDGDG